MKSINEFKANGKIKDLVVKFFEARQVSHTAHLQTKSYAEHKALNSFYDDLLGLTDDFIETYQGQYGIITGYEAINIPKESDMVKYLEDFADEIKSNRENLNKEDTHLQNILDEFLSLTYKTLYKLKYLK